MSEQDREGADERETTHEFQMAIDRERGAIEFLWRGIANGTAAPHEALAWVEAVAQRVVKELLDNNAEPEKRGMRALQALQLYDRGDANWAERRHLERLLCVQRDPPKEISRARRLEYMRASGLYPGLNDRAAHLRIDRLAKEIKADQKIREDRQKRRKRLGKQPQDPS